MFLVMGIGLVGGAIYGVIQKRLAASGSSDAEDPHAEGRMRLEPVEAVPDEPSAL
jgi:hypothetical protein